MTDVTTMLRVSFSLAAVVGLMWIAGRLLKRTPMVRGTQGISVVARAQLGRKSSVALLQVGGRGILVGITEEQISLLGEVDVPKPEAEPESRVSLDIERINPSDLDRIDLREALGSAGTTSPAKPAIGSHSRSTGTGALSGSLLSPATWRQTVDALREKTVR